MYINIRIHKTRRACWKNACKQAKQEFRCFFGRLRSSALVRVSGRTEKKEYHIDNKKRRKKGLGRDPIQLLFCV